MHMHAHVRECVRVKYLRLQSRRDCAVLDLCGSVRYMCCCAYMHSAKHMFVCMYVCVCMYLCMYVCIVCIVCALCVRIH